MQGYVRLAGSLLLTLQLPGRPAPSNATGSVELRLLDWLVEALVNIRREERFFIDVAERYGLSIDITNREGRVVEERKLEGLKRFERLFDGLTAPAAAPAFIPWLEGAVVFWATEKVYFEAWSWAKRQAEGVAEREGDESVDADGGAMRKEFIPNWTNSEFVKFVDVLEVIVNEGVKEAVGEDEKKWEEVKTRAEGRWRELLDAEAAFWPVVETNAGTRVA